MVEVQNFPALLRRGPSAGRRFLSPARLPVSPLSHDRNSQPASRNVAYGGIVHPRIAQGPGRAASCQCPSEYRDRRTVLLRF